MGLITPNDFKELRQLYTAQLRYLLSTENQIVKGLDSMIEHAQDPQLKNAFQTHQSESQTHVTRLESLIGEMDNDVDDKKDPIITALIGSGTNIVHETEEGPVRDAGLIATAQKIEHYEIASYGSAREWAKTLGLGNHAATLEQTLEEEKNANHILTGLSASVNAAAEAVVAN